jgi:YVTN family beta-propeller protein
MLPVIAILCSLLSLASPDARILAAWPVGGEGGWDLLTVDPSSGRLFVPRATHVVVCDRDGKVVGDIPDTKGVHGVVLVPKFDLGYTSNGKSNSVTQFKLSDLSVVKVLPISGINPDAILFDSATSRVFVFNGKSKDASVLDAATGKEIGTVPLGGKPEFAQADGRGRVFVNLEDKSCIVVLDSKGLKVVDTWKLAVEAPTGLALDTLRGLLFSAGEGKLAILDSKTGKSVAVLPTGAGSDAAQLDPVTGRVYVENGDDATLTVVAADSAKVWRVVANIPTHRGAATGALDEKARKLYLPSADFAEKAGHVSKGANLPGSFKILVVDLSR